MFCHTKLQDRIIGGVAAIKPKTARIKQSGIFAEVHQFLKQTQLFGISEQFKRRLNPDDRREQTGREGYDDKSGCEFD
jgi:hypothetical protein